MSFVGFGFIAIFLPVVFCIYCVFREHVKIQNFLLLCASLFFYASFNVKYIMFLLLSIAVTFGGAILGKSINKVFILVALAINISILIFSKYTGLIVQSIVALCGGGATFSEHITAIVGLSFYVFQSSSYLLDVYWDKIGVEKNIVDYALFVSFFGLIVSGPIQKARDFLPQIKKKRILDDAGIQKAILYFCGAHLLK